MLQQQISAINADNSDESDINFDKTISEGAREIGNFDFVPNKPQLKIPKAPIIELEQPKPPVHIHTRSVGSNLLLTTML